MDFFTSIKLRFKRFRVKASQSIKLAFGPDSVNREVKIIGALLVAIVVIMIINSILNPKPVSVEDFESTLRESSTPNMYKRNGITVEKSFDGNIYVYLKDEELTTEKIREEASIPETVNFVQVNLGAAGPRPEQIDTNIEKTPHLGD